MARMRARALRFALVALAVAAGSTTLPRMIECNFDPIRVTLVTISQRAGLFATAANILKANF